MSLESPWYAHFEGSFRFAAEDHKKSTVCSHDRRPANSQQKMNSRKIAASVTQIATPANWYVCDGELEYKPDKVI